MKLQDILTIKGSTVYTISPEATLQDVVRTLVEHRIGSLIVCRTDVEGKQEVAGHRHRAPFLDACTVGSKPLNEACDPAMSKAILTAKPDDEVEEVMGLMTTRRIRHLPVLCDGRLAGMISIGDVVKAQHDRLAHGEPVHEGLHRQSTMNRSVAQFPPPKRSDTSARIPSHAACYPKQPLETVQMRPVAFLAKFVGELGKPSPLPCIKPVYSLPSLSRLTP